MNTVDHNPSLCSLSFLCSGYSKDSGPAAGAAEGDGDRQHSARNHPDAENGPRQTGTGAPAGTGQSKNPVQLLRVWCLPLIAVSSGSLLEKLTVFNGVLVPEHLFGSNSIKKKSVCSVCKLDWLLCPRLAHSVQLKTVM